ncbi:transcription antitermination factor NusB [Phycicoccus sp. SLBN-51]|uniref:RsmB/NOP family class I SAM-dependent RNA methyltransferase n=1 Tax=Phycicoccus sp. SLBN-51 TaxID=2768447 RepID=UPI00115269A3|nr:transcription antitermination factor NusB [Phycicoccus sp. SLBN-51]TQJ51043.1 16S rRNA (cytosine967-C5)-methyltransferase [Phycicoccus sp. SLBN-51]
MSEQSRPERGGHSGGRRGGGQRGGRDGQRGGRRQQGGRRQEYSAQRPSERSRTSDPQRLAAYTVMRAVAEGAYANLELPKVLREKRIHGRDAAFTTELVYGAIRLQGLYDPIIASAAGRPLSKIDANVLDTLRLGAHQLLGMRVPAHAAADETVGLARRVNGAGAAGFVNAVMRRVSERPLDEWLTIVVPEGTATSARLAVEQSHPEWVVKAMRAALLGHRASTPDSVDTDLERLLEADNAAPKVSLVARPGLADVEELVEAGAERSPLSPVAAVLTGGDPGGIPAVREGRAAVQDEGSQLVALALAAVPVESDGRAGAEQWLDLCAGPGGKAGLLAALALRAGADLTANEVSPHRADLVRQTLRPAADRAAEQGRTLEVRTGDGRTVGEDEPGRYQRVLVDAPCTGLGALRRRPEARWRRQPGDLADLGRLQRELLAAAIDATAPGGVVAYATCSPHLAETQFVVSDTTKRRDDVEVLDARPFLRDTSGEPVRDLGDGPTVQLWPHLHGTDGMFLALLRKRA